MAERNIKEGGYQPITDPPAPPNGDVPPQAVNPITGTPNPPAPAHPDGASERAASAPPPAQDSD